MTTKPFIIVNLYHDEMSFYGDSGNVLALQRRLEWRGFPARVHYHRIGDELPDQPDIIVGGGGQDSGQRKIQADLMRIGPDLHKLADNNVPMLMICGLYQLFGHRFVTADHQGLSGIGIFDAETLAAGKRLIGNIVIETEFGELVGFENHSGQTILGTNQPAFGKVVTGYGNDKAGKTEGAVYKNVYGTYLHGAILPKNPALADALIKQAFYNRYQTDEMLATLDDRWATQVHIDAKKFK